jgi:GDP-L-fucose synthase
MSSRATDAFFTAERPDYVFLAAARVGGIKANSTWPVEFLQDNLLIQINVLRAAFRADVARLLFLGSSCVYPKHGPQPLREEHLLTGSLEPTNEAYAIAKIAGIKLCQAYATQHGVRFSTVMPSNVYGPGDNFDPETSHVVPALIRKFCDAVDAGARTVTIWGTGAPRREFLHVDDLADACVFLMTRDEESAVTNVGTGEDVTILELAHLIANLVGYSGSIAVDPSMPDGTPRKILDVSRLSGAGWQARISLRDGLRDTIEWYRQNRETS